MLEFGVASGRLITTIAEQTPGPVYGFDSFEGLPESWFGEYERAPLREPSYCGAKQRHTVQGLVRQQVAGLLADHPDPVSFRHADCDLYSSRVLSRAAHGAMEPAAET